MNIVVCIKPVSYTHLDVYKRQVKIPRLPFDKFLTAKRTLTTQMKATGEVMSICKDVYKRQQKYREKDRDGAR